MPVQSPIHVPLSEQVVISEVTNKGGDDLCGGEDWVELYNMGAEPFSVTGYALDDSSSSPDLGLITDLPAEVAAGKALVLGAAGCPQTVPGLGYLVFCRQEDRVPGAFTFSAAGVLLATYSDAFCGFGFGNGAEDDVVLFSPEWSTVSAANITLDMIVDRTGVWNRALGNVPHRLVGQPDLYMRLGRNVQKPSD